MAKILANDGLEKSAIDALTRAGFEVVTEKTEQSDLIRTINEKGFEIILVRSATTVRKEVIDQCPGIKMIGRGGVGMDNIDVEYARSKGIHVFNTPASSSRSVAELVMAHMFGMARFLADSNRCMPDKNKDFNSLKKKYANGTELYGKTLGIIGFGRIGQCLASYALGCGMQVLACDNVISEATVFLSIAGAGDIRLKINCVSQDEVLKQSDFISLHVPKQAGGAAVIGDPEMKKLKKGVCLINTARGGVIDEKALIKALNDGWVRAASLDVFENEPQPSAELLQHPLLSLTPHIGAATLEAQERIGSEIVQTILHFYKKQPA